MGWGRRVGLCCVRGGDAVRVPRLDRVLQPVSVPSFQRTAEDRLTQKTPPSWSFVRSRIHSHINTWLWCFIQREGGRRFEIARRRETVVEMALVVGHGPVCSRGFVESTSMWSSPASGSSHEWERRKGSGGVFASARKASVVCPLRSYKLGLPHPQESFGWRVH